MDDLLIIEEKIDLEVRSLETCMYDHKTFSEILNRVQKAVDDLNLHSYSNLPLWVSKLDLQVRPGSGPRCPTGVGPAPCAEGLVGEKPSPMDVTADGQFPPRDPR